MTIRVPVSTIKNRWHDAQRVDKQDLDAEQNHNAQSHASIINNHFGSGILSSSLTSRTIFDSDNLTETQASLLAANDLDGKGLSPHLQPTDNELGNQLEVELTGTSAFGRLSTKVLIVGLDFEGNTQLDRFYFYSDEKQVTKKHYTQILGIFFNDFLGNNNCSRSLGGRIVIREASSFQLSRDVIMTSQDVEPNLFFRDFKLSDPTISLFNTIQTGIGSVYSVDSLDINTTVKQNRTLVAGDVSSKIGQKFKATTNNIQKITLLLGVGRDDGAAVENRFDWDGDLVISLYELQTTVSCPTDIVPELAVEFEPKSEPIVQLSFSQEELLDIGYVLTDVLQPVDFVFSSTSIGSATNPKIVPGRFYVVTISRSGAATNGSIVTGVGNNKTEDARLTLYSSGSWVDVEEEDLWFQIWTNAAKVADGQAYDAGNGIQIDKTEINSSGITIDYVLDAQNFADSGSNILNTGIVQAIAEESVEEQDERTGNAVNSRQQFVPSFSFVTSSGLSDLQDISEPLIIGCAKDTNPKQNPLLTKTQTLPGLVSGDVFKVVAPDADLLSLNLIGSKFIPNTDNSSRDYRIFKVVKCTDGYGDVNGDGYIDSDDIARAAALIGEGVESSTTQAKIHSGEIDTLELLRADVDGDGYVTTSDVTLITNYAARAINAFPVGSTFTHLEITVQQSVGRFDGYFDCDGYIRLDGYAGQNIVAPGSLDPAELVYDGYIQDPTIAASDSAFTTIPFEDITYQIEGQQFWQDYLVTFSSDSRKVPASFTFDEGVSDTSPSETCIDTRTSRPECDPGRNDFYVPDNLVIGEGEILRPNGDYYPVDMEVGQITLTLPDEQVFDEESINIFDKFVADAGSGLTSAGFAALKFADGTYVGKDALAKNQVRFDVAIQSVSYNLDGYTESDGYSVIVNEGVRVFVDHSTGIMTFTVNDLFEDPVFNAQSTKIYINVYLKRAGWKNQVLDVESSQISGLIS